MDIDALITMPDPEWPGSCVCAGLHPDTLLPIMLRVKGLDWDARTYASCEVAYILDSAQTERLRHMQRTSIARHYECNGRSGAITLLIASFAHSKALGRK